MAKDNDTDPLAKYVKATGFSDAKIGRLIGVSRWKIGRARRGEWPLSMEEQIALEELTGVPPAEWAEHYAEKVRARGRALKKSPAVLAEGAQ